MIRVILILASLLLAGAVPPQVVRSVYDVRETEVLDATARMVCFLFFTFIFSPGNGTNFQLAFADPSLKRIVKFCVFPAEFDA